MAPVAPAKTQEPLTEEQLSARYAADLVYRALIEAGEPLKASEVARSIDRSDVDLKLVRVMLATNPNMTAVDRKWTIWTRYLDKQNTLDRNLHRILNTFGQPIRIPHLARELESVYGRPAEIYEEILNRLAHGNLRYFRLGEDFIAPTDWLLITESAAQDEILFDNFLDDEDVFPYVAAARSAKVNAQDAAAITAFLDAVMAPIKSRALQYLAFYLDPEHFDARTFYDLLYSDSGTFPLSDGTWIGPALARQLTRHFPTIAALEISENAEAEKQEADKPLEIDPARREELVQAILAADGTQFASRLLEELFDISVDQRTYHEDLQTLVNTLSEDERVAWVGAERFRPQGTIPGYVFTVPGLLDIPEDHYLDADGSLIDQLLDDAGFDGGLEREILNPLAQDVLDEEPVPIPDLNPPSNARAVIKYHHKLIGTLPLCQFPSGFFPAEPIILETEFTLPGGQKAQVWVNNETRLLYGLIDWFQAIPIDSGATFTLERRSQDLYVVNYNDESEPTMFISRNRINELLVLQERAEEEQLPTFDIAREIMEHYRKGIEYITLLTEVNIVRRVTRRMVASILSEYHCFFQRGGAWVFDAKKLVQGFDKSKRKYLMK